MSDIDKAHLQLALFILNKKFHTPNDLLKYWSLTGPCIECHPEVENYMWGEDWN